MTKNEKTKKEDKFSVKVKKYLIHWIRLFKYLKDVPQLTFKNPKFVFSMLVIMVISSAGIWVPWWFNIDLSTVCNIKVDNEIAKLAFPSETNPFDYSTDIFNKSCGYISYINDGFLQNFSFFMFNLGLLGGIAAEYFIRSKIDEDIGQSDAVKDAYQVKEYAGFFVWVIALILSFNGIKEPLDGGIEVVIATWLSISLWICTNLTKKEYEMTNPNNLLGGDSPKQVHLTGSGLPEEQEAKEASILGGGIPNE